MCRARGVFILPVGAKVFVFGSKISALATDGLVLSPLNPPAIRTVPLDSSVAVCLNLGLFMFPIAVNAPAP